MVNSNPSRRRFLKLSATGAVVVVVAGIGTFLAMQTQPQPQRPAPVATPKPAPAATPSSPSTPLSKPQPTPSLVEEATKEGKIMIYHPLSIPAMDAAKTVFEKKYPGVKLEHLKGFTELVERLMTETRTGKHIMDVYFGSQAYLTPFIEAGYAAKYTSPLDDEYPKELKFPQWEGFFSPVVHTAIAGIVYHADLKADAPKDYWDVFKPRFKGRLGLFDMPIVPYLYVTLERKIIDPEKYISWLQRVKEWSPRIGSSTGTLLTLIVNKEVDASFPAYISSTRERMEKGEPLDYVRTPGTVIGDPMGLAVNKFAPHPNAARLFRDFILSEEGVKLIAERGGYVPHRPGVPSFIPGIQPKDVVITPFLAEKDIIEAKTKYEKIFVK